MATTKIDVKLMKLHECLERMWNLFFAKCREGASVKDYLHEKERCHELMAEISEEVNQKAESIGHGA